jgi:hypothetical protein
MPEADDNHTSARLRAAAVQAIHEAQRPLTAHQIEAWIRDRDPALSAEVKGKCYDYARMILSLSPPSQICKYRSQIMLAGIDARAAFYGLPRERYPETWVPTAKMPTKGLTPKPARPAPLPRPNPVPAASQQSSIFLVPQSSPIAPLSGQLAPDPQSIPDPWANLPAFPDTSDVFWLPNFTDSGKSNVSGGFMFDDPGFGSLATVIHHPTVFGEVLTMLTKETVQKHGTLWFTDILDNVV